MLDPSNAILAKAGAMVGLCGQAPSTAFLVGRGIDPISGLLDAKRKVDGPESALTGPDSAAGRRRARGLGERHSAGDASAPGIDRPNQVWCADITYIPMRRGFLYLVAIMDWASRNVLAWRLSNTMDTEFCIEALDKAIGRCGTPEIFNTDQGSQFTSPRFTGMLKEAKVRISMDGKGRWMDNVFIERLWRSLKYECVYLHAFETGAEARKGVGDWIESYGEIKELAKENTPTRVSPFSTRRIITACAIGSADGLALVRFLTRLPSLTTARRYPAEETSD